MADRFLERVAQVSGDTARALKEISKLLEEMGLEAQAKLCERIAEEHRQIVYDCLVDTQPIETER